MQEQRESTNEYSALAEIIRAKKQELKVFESADDALNIILSLEQKQKEIAAKNDALSLEVDQKIEKLSNIGSELAKKNSEANKIISSAEAVAAAKIKEAEHECDARLASAKEVIAEINRRSKEEIQKSLADAQARKEKIESEASMLEAKSAEYIAVKERNDIVSAELLEKEARLEAVKKQLSSILNIGE